MSTSSARLARLRTPVLTVLDQGLFSLTNLALQIIVARYVAADEFGAYAVGSTFFFMAALCHQTFMIEPMFVFTSRRYQDRLGAYYHALRRSWSVSFGALSVGTGLVIAAVAAQTGSTPLALSIAAFALSSPILLYFWLLRRIAFLLHRIELAVLGGAIYAAVLLAGAALLVYAGRMSSWTGIALSGVAAIPAALVLGFSLPWPSRSTPSPPDMLSRHLRYGRWAFGSEVVNWAMTNGPLLILPILFGLGASGLLRVVSLLFMPLLQFISATMAIVLRHFASQRPEDDVLGSALRFSWLLVAGASAYAIVAVVLGPLVLPRLFGPGYLVDRSTIAFGGLSTTLFVGAQALFAALRAAERSGHVFAVHLVALGVTATTLPFFLPRGVEGAFLAQACAWSAAGIVAWRLARSEKSRPGDGMQVAGPAGE